MRKGKILTALIGIITVFRLAGCSAKPAESPKAVTDENFKMVNYWQYNYRSYDENGYYDVLQRDDHKGSNITFADFSSATETYLCNRAECKHNDDTCTSFFGNEYNSIRLFPSYEDDKILCLANYYPESGASFLRLLSFDRNGENRQVVIDFGIDTDTTDGVAISEDMILLTMAHRDGDKDEEVKRSLVLANYKTGEWKSVFDYDAYYTFTSVFNNRAYLIRYEDNYKCIVSAVDLKDGNIADVYEFTVYGAGEWKSPLPPIYVENYLYRLSDDGKDLLKVNLDTGESSALIPDVNNYFDAGNGSCYDVIDNHFRIQTSKLISDNEFEEHRYSVDVATGRVYPRTMEVMYKDGKLPIIYPIAEFGDNLYVVCGVEKRPHIDYDIDNIPYESEWYVTVHGIISKADYYANIPNIKIVEMI